MLQRHRKKLILFSVLIITIILIIGSINLYMYLTTKDQFSKELENADCILVLGAGIRNNQPSPMLQDRLDEAIALYQQGKAPKIIMSGDHGKDDYNEVSIMKQYAIDQGIPSSDIFMDHAGFSTYDSLYRVKEIFQAENIIVVTQDYHLYRALYIANHLGISAVGYPSNPRNYNGQFSRDLREIIARCKDFVTCMIKPEPTYLGEVIPVSGNGDVTNN